MSKLTQSLNKIKNLDELSEGQTWVHSLHPMAKMITTAFYLVVVISFDKYDISGMIPFFLYPILIMSLGEIPYGLVLSRLLVALPFSFFAGLSNLFLDRQIVFMLFQVPVTYGLLSFFSIILKTVLTVMSVLILIATTPMDKISHELIKRKVPKIFIVQMMLTFRYLRLIMSEAGHMVTAYHLRSLKQKGIQLHHAGSFLGQLLLRSFDKADRIYFAMKCRGYQGDFPSAVSESMKWKDTVYWILLCSLFLLLRFVNFSLLIGTAIG